MRRRRTGAFNFASATIVASATALPDMSVCMSSIERCALRLVPPVSKRIPLPTSATSMRGVARAAARWPVTQVRDAGITARIAAADGEKRAGTEFFQGGLVVPAQPQAMTP